MSSRRQQGPSGREKGPFYAHPGPLSLEGRSLSWGLGLWEDQSWDDDRFGRLSGQTVAKTGGVGVSAGTEGGGPIAGLGLFGGCQPGSGHLKAADGVGKGRHLVPNDLAHVLRCYLLCRPFRLPSRENPPCLLIAPTEPGGAVTPPQGRATGA